MPKTTARIPLIFDRYEEQLQEAQGNQPAVDFHDDLVEIRQAEGESYRSAPIFGQDDEFKIGDLFEILDHVLHFVFRPGTNPQFFSQPLL